MLVLLNGGFTRPSTENTVKVALADACVTEWRVISNELATSGKLHSLMPVL